MSRTNKELEKIFNDAIQLDQPIYDEMKTNVLLKAGLHYTKKNSSFNKAIRESAAISSTQKIRLTQNHINKAMNIYKNNILSLAPGSTIIAKNPSERQDQADADLSLAVWEDFKYKDKYSEKVDKLADDYTTLGECWIETLWDPNGGKLIGYEALTDENGEFVLDEDGEKKPDKKKPVFEGAFVRQIIPGYDVFRSAASKTLEESPFIGYRKMVSKKELEQKIKNDPDFTEEEKEERLNFLKDEGEDTYAVFNGVGVTTDDSHELIMVKKFYYYPDNNEFPNGRYYLKVRSGILWEGDLQQDDNEQPIFPLYGAKFDEFQGHARGFSKIKQVRGVQGEMNRSASKIAETQITLGDDKLITMFGGGITEGEKMPGIREIKTTSGQDVKILPGRSGEQYLPYLQYLATIFYGILDIQEDSEVRQDGASDITATLYNSLRSRKKYVIYSNKFERLLQQDCETVLRLAKANYRDDMIIKAVGDCKAINVPEFKRVDGMSYDIKVVPRNDDIDSMMGKYLTYTNTLQFVGSRLNDEQLGVVLRNYPFANSDQAFKSFTQNADKMNNIILRLDRGEMPVISKFDDNDKIVASLVNRMNEPDFEFKKEKDPEITERYMKQYEERTQILNQQVEELRKANAGTIPTGGAKIRIDMYEADPNNPKRSRRMEVDQVSMQWFKQRLEEQGAGMPDLGSNQAELDVLQGGGPEGQAPIPMNK